MEIVCPSRLLETAVSTALDVKGREHLIVVIKATWRLPDAGQRPRPLKPQPLAYEDDYYGAPGESAMRYGDDFARFKPRCDVLFDSLAHAPAGRPVTSLGVGVRVGGLAKSLKVHGPRKWESGVFGQAISAAEPFVAMPLHYGLAFGGTRSYKSGDGKTLTEALLDNPAGIGWYGAKTQNQLGGQPAASLECFDESTGQSSGRFRPVALSAIGRHWAQRSRYAGTYDKAWFDTVRPFLPEDFDERFHQCAPEDQQIDYPRGGEPVKLVNLVADKPQLEFTLPPLKHVRVRILRSDYTTEEPDTHVDTLFFETEQNRFSAVWRASTPIRRRIQEFDTIAVGPVDNEWWRAKTLGIDGDCAGCGDGA